MSGQPLNGYGYGEKMYSETLLKKQLCGLFKGRRNPSSINFVPPPIRGWLANLVPSSRMNDQSQQLKNGTGRGWLKVGESVLWTEAWSGHKWVQIELGDCRGHQAIGFHKRQAKK